MATRKGDRVKVPAVFLIDMVLQATGALVLAINALPNVQNTGVYAIGLILVLGLVMFALVRRIASLVVGDGRRVVEFDPHQG